MSRSTYLFYLNLLICRKTHIKIFFMKNILPSKRNKLQPLILFKIAFTSQVAANVEKFFLVTYWYQSELFWI